MNGDCSFPPQVHQALVRQIFHMMSKSPPDIRLTSDETDVTQIKAEIDGPSGTCYQGGTFKLVLSIPPEFPSIPPKGYFLTRIFHPNVSNRGDICVNTLKKDWDPKKFSLSHILEVIKCLLIIPFPESSLNEEAGKLFMEDYSEYSSRAKLMTNIYAMPQNDENKNIFACGRKTEEKISLGKRPGPSGADENFCEQN